LDSCAKTWKALVEWEEIWKAKLFSERSAYLVVIDENEKCNPQVPDKRIIKSPSYRHCYMYWSIQKRLNTPEEDWQLFIDQLPDNQTVFFIYLFEVNPKQAMNILISW
jgi:hypothetical protein